MVKISEKDTILPDNKKIYQNASINESLKTSNINF